MSERVRLQCRLRALDPIPFRDADWEQAAAWKSDLRRKGLTIPSLDLLVAAPVDRVKGTLMHVDHHFDQLASRVGLKVESHVSALRARR